MELSLNGAEKDVLYKLGKYGSQEDGDLPSKLGMESLIGKGFAEKDHSHDKPNFLTINGFMLYDNIFG